MKNRCLLVHCISSFEGISYKRIQHFTLHHNLHEEISFLQLFKNLIQHLLEKDFCHKFSFFNGFTQTLTPEQLKSAKHDKSFFVDAP